MALELTDANFEASALDTDKLVMIDFWAQWCGPCKMLSPIVEQLAEEHGDVVIGKLDVDNNPEVSTKYGIRSLPTILWLKGGEVVDKHVGLTTKAKLEEKIQSHLQTA